MAATQIKLNSAQRKGMQGTIAVPFSELFADTVQAHGLKWARAEYRRCGMSDWEVDMWTAIYVRGRKAALQVH